MAELRIPFVLWFRDEAPPDFTILIVPVAVAVSFHSEVETTTPQGEKDNGQSPLVRAGSEADG
jgi:hypothetical protein